jgi:hypothetical protein
MLQKPFSKKIPSLFQLIEKILCLSELLTETSAADE